jgi:endonuclease-3
MDSTPALALLIADLEALHGTPEPPAVVDPFEMVLLENVAYLVDDERRAAAFARLGEAVGLSPEAILAAPFEELARVIAKGGMKPEHRAAKLRAAAEIASELLPGGLPALRALCREDPVLAAKVLRRFPGIGEPGADKILLFGHARRTLAPDSNALRVLRRYGFGREEKDYGRTYRSVTASVAPQLPDDSAWLIRAHQLLRRHGQEICKAGVPLCERCPLTPRCRWYLQSAAGGRAGEA